MDWHSLRPKMLAVDRLAGGFYSKIFYIVILPMQECSSNNRGEHL